jgi:type II secretory pathway pseudopilin PulG
MCIKRKAQIWVETVIYTVIGLAIIGIVLAIATPAINKYKDEVIIEQTITVLEDLNSEILDAKYYGLGNKIPFEFRIKKGSISIDSKLDKIVYVLEESGLKYSEVGERVDDYGSVIIETNERGSKFDIILSLEYDDINITYKGKEQEKVFSSATTPYKIFIENSGPTGEKIQVDIQN